MSKPANTFSLSGSTVVRPSVVSGLNVPDSNPSFLRPCYYLERPDGSRTALVEVDQLPELVRIRGLPPKLSVTDTAGMTSVGIKEGGHRKYTVEIADGSANLHNGHTDLEKASATITTPPSSKAPVSRSSFEFPEEDFFANYTIERHSDSVQRRSIYLYPYPHRPRDRNFWANSTKRGKNFLYLLDRERGMSFFAARVQVQARNAGFGDPRDYHGKTFLSQMVA